MSTLPNYFVLTIAQLQIPAKGRRTVSGDLSEGKRSFENED